MIIPKFDLRLFNYVLNKNYSIFCTHRLQNGTSGAKFSNIRGHRMISLAQNFTFGWLVIFSNKTGQITTIWVMKCVFHGKYGVHLVILGTIGLCPEF